MVASTYERERLLERLEKSRTTINRGIVLLAMVPVVVVGCAMLAVAAGALAIAVMTTVLYVLGGGFGGIAMIVAGTVEHRGVTRQLRAIDELHQLPAARVVIR